MEGTAMQSTSNNNLDSVKIAGLSRLVQTLESLGTPRREAVHSVVTQWHLSREETETLIYLLPN